MLWVLGFGLFGGGVTTWLVRRRLTKRIESTPDKHTRDELLKIQRDIDSGQLHWPI